MQLSRLHRVKKRGSVCQKGRGMPSEAEFGSHPSSDGERGRPTLLCVGNDETLLSYRSKVLNLAGFDVVAARPRPEQQNQFASLCRLHGPSLAVVCHTLTLSQRIALARELRAACPDMGLLALTNGALTAVEAQSYDVLLDSLDGPAELIRQVRSHIEG
jgi:ActR/RegA family two-component response regulator